MHTWADAYTSELARSTCLPHNTAVFAASTSHTVSVVRHLHGNFSLAVRQHVVMCLLLLYSLGEHSSRDS